MMTDLVKFICYRTIIQTKHHFNLLNALINSKGIEKQNTNTKKKNTELPCKEKHNLLSRCHVFEDSPSALQVHESFLPDLKDH